MYDALQVVGGFFDGYGWDTLGKEILEFDQALNCTDELVILMEDSLNKLYDDYHNSPCIKKGSSSHISRPWYDSNSQCEETWGYQQCQSCFDWGEYYYPYCADVASLYSSSATSCGYCYPACPAWDHPESTFEFMLGTGMFDTTYKTVESATKLVKCIQKDLEYLVGNKTGAEKKTVVQKVIDDTMPELVDALDAASGGISYAALEAGNAAKIGTHVGYLISYFKSKSYQNIGWELGAIAFDITQAIKGESSVTIDGETFDFVEVKDQ